MSAVDDLLRQYVAAFEASGDADPVPYLDQLSGTDRDALAAQIDDYLTSAPPRAYSPDAFAAFHADARRQAMVERVLDDVTLQALRREAGVTKAAMGGVLAPALGLAGAEQRVKARYHDLESGSVDPERVRPRVWDALSTAFGASVERVRQAADNAFAGAGGLTESVVFARTADIDVSFSAMRAPGDTAGQDEAVDAAFFED